MLTNHFLATAFVLFSQTLPPVQQPPEDLEIEGADVPATTTPALVVPDGILPVSEICRVEHGPSDRTRVLLHESKLILVTGSGAVEARDTATGEFSWKLGLPGEVLFPPVTLRSEPFEILLASPTGKVLVVDGASGNIRREIDLGLEIALPPHPAGGDLFLGTSSGIVVAIDLATGTERYRAETGERPLAFSAGDGLLVVSGAERTLTAMSAATGEVRWAFHARAGFPAPAVFHPEGGRLYIGDDAGEFYCLDAQKGNVRFRWSTGASIRNAALVVGKRVYVTSFGNILYAFDAGGGAEQFRANLPGRPASGAVLVRNRLLVVTFDGTVVEVNLERGQIGKTYSAPGELFGAPSFFVALEVPRPAVPDAADPLALPDEEGPRWYERHRIALTLRSGQVLLLGHHVPTPEPELAPELASPPDVPRGTPMSWKEDAPHAKSPYFLWFPVGTERAMAGL